VVNDVGHLLLLSKTSKTPAINFQQLITGFQSTILNNRHIITIQTESDHNTKLMTHSS